MPIVEVIRFSAGMEHDYLLSRKPVRFKVRIREGNLMFVMLIFPFVPNRVEQFAGDNARQVSDLESRDP
jgi:hypothetical protein